MNSISLNLCLIVCFFFVGNIFMNSFCALVVNNNQSLAEFQYSMAQQNDKDKRIFEWEKMGRNLFCSEKREISSFILQLTKGRKTSEFS